MADDELSDKKIRSNGTSAQIEIFDGLGHGFGLGEGTVAQGWIDRAINFWEQLSRLIENTGAASVDLSATEVKALDDALDNMEMSAVYGGASIKWIRGKFYAEV